MSTTPFDNKKFFLNYLILWIIWVAIHTLVLIQTDLPYIISLSDSLISNTIIGLVSFFLIRGFQYFNPDKQRYAHLLFKSLVGVFVATSITQLTLQTLFTDDVLYLEFLDQTLIIRILITFLLIVCFLMVVGIWIDIVDSQEDDKRKRSSEQMSKEAELFKLRQQLQPHFLFNSLNSINALIGAQPAEARNMIQKLSDFLRGTLKGHESELYYLKDELNHLQLYLDIEKIRFGNRLNVCFKIADETKDCLLPGLILQPMVENAIKFGLYGTTGLTDIHVKTKIEKGMLQISIRNPFDSDSIRSQQGTGFGLSSVKRRLYLLYARNDLMESFSEGNIYTIRLSIPLQDDKSTVN